MPVPYLPRREVHPVSACSSNRNATCLVLELVGEGIPVASLAGLHQIEESGRARGD
jgi:hypothetical protein